MPHAGVPRPVSSVNSASPIESAKAISAARSLEMGDSSSVLAAVASLRLFVRAIRYRRSVLLSLRTAFPSALQPHDFSSLRQRVEHVRVLLHHGTTFR